MKSRERDKINAIITASNYNNLFRTIYKNFEKDIFLKIKNKEPVHESLLELAFDGCIPKPTYFFGATYYMRVELTIEHVLDLRDTIFSQLYPVLRNSQPQEMELLLHCLLDAIAKKIFRMDVVEFEDLKNINYGEILLSSKKFISTELHHNPQIVNILQHLPQEREKFQVEYDHYIGKMVNSRTSLWHIQDLSLREYEREIETEFVLTSIKL